MSRSRSSTIPYTPTSPGWTSVNPRPLRLVRPHSDLDKIPTPILPPPSRAPIFHTTPRGIYRLSTHLIPAASPRVVPDVPHPEIPPFTPDASAGERRDRMDAVVTHVLEMQVIHDESRLGGKPSEKILWNCLNRYVRMHGLEQATAPGGVTLFLVHANGLHKETWEPTLRALLDAPAGEIIDEVWAWEAVQHGDAAVVNGQNLSVDWLDNSRDIANFLLHYLPEEVEMSVLPARLPCLPASVIEARREQGYHKRTLVVIGHSFGGCTSLRVAFDFPKLFSSFVLVDSVIHRPYSQLPGSLHQMVLNAFSRRDRWSSREEALQLFQKSPFFGAWHPDVLRLYIDHGLTDDAEGGVRLKTPGLQEGLSFANRRPPWETWELLERLDERITLRWVIPEKPLSTRELAYERVWRRPVNSSNVVFHFSGHLIVQEAPCELAHDVSDFLLRNYGCIKPRL